MASRTVEDIAEYIKKMRFKKGFYGIKPASVWKKIEDLNEENTRRSFRHRKLLMKPG